VDPACAPHWNGQQAHDGWNTAPVDLVTRIGLPASAPDTGGGSHVWGRLALAVAALLVALLVRSIPRLRRASTA
jgi:hypothetical protein